MEIHSRPDKLQLTGDALRRSSRTRKEAEGEPPAVEDTVSLHGTGKSPLKARIRQSSQTRARLRAHPPGKFPLPFFTPMICTGTQRPFSRK